jgi:hypothetical protein
MTALRRIEGDRAGPGALGILVPPGPRTVLIVRPRPLDLDLLLVQGVAGTAFRELSREEAPAVAAAFYRALEAWSLGGPGHVGAAAGSEGGYFVWLDVGDFALVVCARVPGQPYQPLVYDAEDEARAAADRLRTILHPAPGTTQEVYFNTRHFERAAPPV